MNTVKNHFLVEQLGAFEKLRTSTGDKKAKQFMGDTLGLTGCEVSINCLPADEFVPFVHTHKKMKNYTLSLRVQASSSLTAQSFPSAKAV